MPGGAQVSLDAGKSSDIHTVMIKDELLDIDAVLSQAVAKLRLLDDPRLEAAIADLGEAEDRLLDLAEKIDTAGLN